MLLYAGANVRATTRLGGYTPLHLASQGGHAPVVAALVAAGADANAATTTGATPLMLAAAVRQRRRGEALLEAGADVNAKETANGQTALMFAAGLDRADVVRLLLARGADCEGRRRRSSTSPRLTAPPTEAGTQQRQSRQRRPAGRRRAGTQCDGAPASTRGVSLQRADRRAGRPDGAALRRAAGQRRRRRRRCVERGADVNQRQPGRQDRRRCSIAIINGHFDLAMYLLEHGADPEPRERRRRDAALRRAQRPVGAEGRLSAAARATCSRRDHYLDLMKLLLDKGADPNARLRPQGLVLGLQLRPVGRRRSRRDAVLARRLCQRRRGDAAAGRRTAPIRHSRR